MYVSRKKNFTNGETKDIIILSKETVKHFPGRFLSIRYSFVSFPQYKSTYCYISYIRQEKEYLYESSLLERHQYV